MGQMIWGVLETYAGLWVAVDKRGRVVACAKLLPDLESRAGKELGDLTFVFAADSNAAEAA